MNSWLITVTYLCGLGEIAEEGQLARSTRKAGTHVHKM